MFESTLTPVLHEIFTRWEIPGLSLGLVQDNEIIYAREFGVQNLKTLTTVSFDTLFCMASVSKPFVATAIMQLVEKGEIDLDIPIIQYLPYFEIDDDRYQQITPRQILSHTSGMPDLTELEYIELWKYPEYDDSASERFVKGLRKKKLVADPGERFHYSNIAYNVLGHLIAKVTGISFERYMKEHILVPAGMPHSTYLIEEIPKELMAVPHLRAPGAMVNPIYPYHRADGPSSNLHSSAREMCQWCKICLELSNSTVWNILNPDHFETMWTPAIKRGGLSINEFTGLGWNLGTYKGEKTISHMGGAAGFNSFLVILPVKSRAAVAMFNTESQAIYRILWAVLDALVDEEPLAKSVSWMLPVSRALELGGIDKAHSLYKELKENHQQEEYFIDKFSLIMLAQHLMMADKAALAIEVLRFNIEVFPGDSCSYVCLARAYLTQKKIAQAEESIRKALLVNPDDFEAIDLMKNICDCR
ncbi:serine hydrolase [bacterium]|nr:serine hydrolase [candidate division CSSED10-310 bacterium]